LFLNSRKKLGIFIVGGFSLLAGLVLVLTATVGGAPTRAGDLPAEPSPFTVSTPANGTGYTFNALVTTSVAQGSTYQLQLSRGSHYVQQSAPVLSWNGTAPGGASIRQGYSNGQPFSPTGGIYCWEITVGSSNISASNFTLTYPLYSIATVPASGTGWALIANAGPQGNGQSWFFRIQLNAGYTNSPNPTVTVSPASNAGVVTASKSGNIITYTIPSITGNITSINVGVAIANNYTVVKPPESGAGWVLVP